MKWESVVTFVTDTLSKFLSRKIVVWITSTIFLATGSINAEQWFGITMTYLGVEGGADMVTRFTTKKDVALPAPEDKKDG